MNLTYEQFKNIVPKETIDFVDLALPYLERYLKDGRNIKFKRTEVESENYYSKVAMILFYCLSQNEKYNIFLSKAGFEASRFKLETENNQSEISKSIMFEHCGSLFTFYNDLSLYMGLKPLDIIKNSFILYRNNRNISVYTELFPRTSIDSFSNELESIIRKENEILEQKIEKDVYGCLPISIIYYLETATKIRTILYETINSRNIETVSCTEKDIVPLSMLLALYYYKEENLKDNEITDQMAIKEYIKEKGVTLEGINQILGFTIGSRIMSETKKNVFVLPLEYARYFNDGINKEKNTKDINLASIITNLFNRNFTNSLVIEKIFAKQNCYVGSINNLEEEIKRAKEIKKHLYSLEYVKSFYSELPKETRNFIDFTAKTYTLLLEKMKKNEHNSKYLFNEDDADTLALYIANSFYNGDVDEFFKDNGVTLDKVLRLLNLSITKEEIKSTNLEHKILVDRYKRFVYDGVNRGKYSNAISVDDISNNLCNREFNRSMILENVFDDITDKIDLKSDFLEQLKKHLDEKEKQRKRILTQKLFHDMPAESMEYMETVSSLHKLLKEKNISYNESDIKTLSLLLGICLTEQSEVNNFFKSKGLEYNKICNILNISISQRDRLNLLPDIDLLSEQYGQYIFGGNNKDLDRKELTVFNISKNIFNKELNNSVEISRFLSNFDLNNEFFENFDQNYNLYLEETKEKRKQEEAKNLLSSFQKPTVSYISNVLKIHNRLEKLSQEDVNIKQKLCNTNDIVELSFVLGLFTEDNDISHFFEKNGLTITNILSILGINSEIIENLSYDELDYNLLLEQYKGLIKTNEYNHNKRISDIAQKIFEPKFSKESLILEQLSATLGADYNILKEEVETKRDYELSLTMDDRITLLSNTTVDTLNLDDVKSILHFGNSLSTHSKYIHDELPKLMLDDSHDKSIETINSIINRIYIKEENEKPKKKNFLAQLFSISTEEEKTRIVINHMAVQELKDAIEENIELLSKELVGYDSIRKYIEVYRRKNRSHLLVASDEITKIEERISTLNPDNDEEYFVFLQATSNLQVMKNKVNRFNTTNQLMKQELIKVNQAIVNHFITINALEMARDDLFPLIGSELSIIKGRETENQALDLSQNVIGLFQSLLTRNVDCAVENIEKLKQSSLPESICQTLNKDIETYLKEINQSNNVVNRIEDYDIDLVEHSSTILSLDNTKNHSVQKVISNNKK